MNKLSKNIIRLWVIIFFIIQIHPHSSFASDSLSEADLNNDLIIDAFDYNLLVTNYNNPYKIFAYQNLINHFGKKITDPVANLQTYGFDPGLTKKLAATFEFDDTYYENCPDSTNGQCKNTLSPGAGFYTLQSHASVYDNHESMRLKCKTNKEEEFFDQYLVGINNTDGTQHCPNKFAWTTNSNGKLAAKLTTDSLDWAYEQKSSIFTGLQSNIPYGGKYMGGNNHPNINDYSIKFMAKAFNQAPVGYNPSDIKVRYLVGVGWWVPDLQHGFVLEMNLDALNIEGQPEWDTQTKYNENHHFPNPQTTPLYLGGRFWNVPKLINKGEVQYHIDWTSIVKRLINDGDLPQEALGDYPASFYFGPETINPSKATMTVSEIYMLSSPSN